MMNLNIVRENEKAIVSKLMEVLGAEYVSNLLTETTIALTKHEVVDYTRDFLWSQKAVVFKEITTRDNRNAEMSNTEADSNTTKAGCIVNNTIIPKSFMTNQLSKFEGKKQLSMGSYNITVGTDGDYDLTNDMVVVKAASLNDVQRNKAFGFYYIEASETVYLRIFVDGEEKLIKNGLEIVSDEIAQKVKEQGILYVQFIWSPGQKKKDACFFINANKYDSAARFELLNRMTGGALKEKAEKAFKAKGCLDEKDMEKLTARFPLFATGAMEFGTLATERFGVLYIDKKLNGFADKLASHLESNPALVRLVNGVSDNAIDGQVWSSNLHVAESMLTSMNVLVDPDDLVGFDYQGRTMSISTKAFVTVEEHEMLQELAKYFLEHFSEYVTVYGNKDCIGLITDANGAKLVIESGDNFKNYLLEVAKSGPVSFSGQLADIISYMAGEIGQLDKFNAFVESKAYDNALETIDAMSTQVLNKNCACDNLLMAVNKSVALTDTIAMSSFARSVAKMNIGKASKNKISLKGYSQRIVLENTAFWGKGIVNNVLKADGEFVYAFNNKVLNDNRKEISEIYTTWKEANNTANTAEEKAIALFNRKKALDAILSGVLIKYPAVSIYEAEAIRYLTKFEIKELFREEAKRCGLNFDDSRIQNSLKWILNRGEGTIVLAAINILKDKHAGMDTDFDPVNIYMDKEIVDIVLAYKASNEFGGEMTLITSDDNLEEFNVDTFVDELLENVVVEKATDFNDCI